MPVEATRPKPDTREEAACSKAWDLSPAQSSPQALSWFPIAVFPNACGWIQTPGIAGGFGLSPILPKTSC